MLQIQITALPPIQHAHVQIVHCAFSSAAPRSRISHYPCKDFTDQYK